MPRSPSKMDQYSQRKCTEPLEKRSEKDKISLDKLSCRLATKFFVKVHLTPKNFFP